MSASSWLWTAALVAVGGSVALTSRADTSPPTAPFARLDRLTAEQLQEQLLRVPEIDLLATKQARDELLLELAANAEKRSEAAPPRNRPPAALDFQARQWKTLGLTCRPESDRLLFRHEAEYLEHTARLLRTQRVVSVLGRGGDTLKPTVTTFDRFREAVNATGAELPHHLTPAINQIMQAEGEASRALLVEAMGRIDTNYSTCCLTERALFDVSPKVRASAIQALTQRPREEFRPTLLDAFRYPWAPVAQHAAEALVALQDREALPALNRLLDARDPTAPYISSEGNGKPRVRELVRVNHLRNCVLCHAPSTSSSDLVVAPVPKPGEPLMILYYDSPRPRQPSADDIFVRADVTYLRQDFSLTQPVENAVPWPTAQRFDFLVRTRAATEKDMAKKPATVPAWREAVLFAIAGLKKVPAGDAGTR